ncbi:hypothetical protein CYMTET_53136 [Cymbomonas tetramitiformis]|uniref:Uncharacterized protein n=1 Tax=Cymbomonas tetramitiformis TaxID=36881 RepID=A0AAE0EQW7_9CHLO|nr:hypothetical protein CYMTET_53136 [Cymbomonas tetramitiformis]
MEQVLETGDECGVRWALEGIVRQIRASLPVRRLPSTRHFPPFTAGCLARQVACRLAPQVAGCLAPQVAGCLARQVAGRLAPQMTGCLAPQAAGCLARRWLALGAGRWLAVSRRRWRAVRAAGGWLFRAAGGWLSRAHVAGRLAPLVAGCLASQVAGCLAPQAAGCLAPQAAGCLVPQVAGHLALQVACRLAPQVVGRSCAAGGWLSLCRRWLALSRAAGDGCLAAGYGLFLRRMWLAVVAGRLAPQVAGRLALQVAGCLARQVAGRLAPQMTGCLAPQAAGCLAPQAAGCLCASGDGLSRAAGGWLSRAAGGWLSRAAGYCLPLQVVAGRLEPLVAGYLAPQVAGCFAPQVAGCLAPQEAEIVFVYMHLRSDVDTQRRTGTQAWVDGVVPNASDIYHRLVPNLYDAISQHYSIPSINLIQAAHEMRRQCFSLDHFFRDDCHHTPAGAAVMASIIGACLERCFGQVRSERGDEPKSTPTLKPQIRPMPPAMDASHWSGGQALQVGGGHLRFVDGIQTPGHRRSDRDPISGEAANWWMLNPGDEARIAFEGTGFGLLTHVGPDSGYIRCELARIGGAKGDIAAASYEIFDQWSYYYRLSVIMLYETLPAGSYEVKISLEETSPNRTKTRRPCPPGVQGPLQLWLSYYLAPESIPGVSGQTRYVAKHRR